jgi:transposase-like protein
MSFPPARKGSRYPFAICIKTIEQDHRFIKRRVQPSLGFWSFETAWRTLQGYEAMNQLRKGQVQGTNRGDIRSQVRFVEQAFGLTA